MSTTTKPFRRNVSRTIRVQAIDGLGEPLMLELQAEEWLHVRTRRYRRLWSARRVGRLGWDASSSAREALRRAAYLPEGQRPAWLTQAVKRAEGCGETRSHPRRRPGARADQGPQRVWRGA